jgi:hypothetical protein
MKNHPWASPAFQFKKYAQNMIFLMGDMVRRASFGTPQEKKIAARQLMSLLAVQMAMAGAAGLPGLELLKVGFMVASMLGLGGGWEDWQRKLRKTFEASYRQDADGADQQGHHHARHRAVRAVPRSFQPRVAG